MFATWSFKAQWCSTSKWLMRVSTILLFLPFITFNLQLWEVLENICIKHIFSKGAIKLFYISILIGLPRLFVWQKAYCQLGRGLHLYSQSIAPKKRNQSKVINCHKNYCSYLYRSFNPLPSKIIGTILSSRFCLVACCLAEEIWLAYSFCLPRVRL